MADDKTTQGGQDTKAASPTVPPDDAVISLTVDNEVKQYTLAEIKTMASKAAGADRRFADAAATRKEAQDAIGFREHIRGVAGKAEKGDDAALRELGTMLGQNPQDIENYIQERDAALAEARAAGVKVDDAPPIARLSDDDRAKVDAAAQVGLDATRQKIMGEMKIFLDKDPVIGDTKIANKEARQALLDILEREVVGRLARKQGQYGPDMLTDAIQTVRAFARQLGILKPADGTPAAETAQQKLARLGIGLGPSQASVVEAIQAGKAIPRAKVTDPDYAENFAARALLEQGGS